MKIYIVLLSFLVISVSCLDFTADFNNYVRAQLLLKAAAEDCAAAAALCIDYDSYAEGVFRIDEEKAANEAQVMLEKNTALLFPQTHMQIEFEDLSVTVELRYKDILRRSTYSWESGM